MKRTKDLKTNKGITLIALVITIIVMLILVGVSISMAVNGGLFNYAGKAVTNTKDAITAENKIGEGGVTVDGKVFTSIDDYIKETEKDPEKEPEEDNVELVDFILTMENREKIGYTSTTQKLEIPEKFYDETDKKWYKVVEIAASCFSNFSGETPRLNSVTIPGTVKKIGEKAFYNTSLSTVILNEGLEEIGKSAFSTCRYLKNIVIPKGITKLDEGTFTGTQEMTITIPKTVTEIGDQCFWPYGKLTVNYEGTEEEWSQITITGSNPRLSGDDFTINYNYSYDS